MPRMAITHIQKMEPGPPLMMAVAMPTMLPVPMVAARAVQRLWNWLMALSSRLVWAVMCLSVKMAPMVLRIQWAKWANWNPRFRMVMHRPAANSSARPKGPQTKLLTVPFRLVMVSIMMSLSLFPKTSKRKRPRCPPLNCPQQAYK